MLCLRWVGLRTRLSATSPKLAVHWVIFATLPQRRPVGAELLKLAAA